MGNKRGLPINSLIQYYSRLKAFKIKKKKKNTGEKDKLPINILCATLNLLSANVFNLDLLKILLSGQELTHSHTMTPFDAPGKQAF